MHILSIYNQEENKILRQSSRPVTDADFQNKTTNKIIQQLEDGLVFYGNGVGLSASQIGKPLQIFMINCRPTETFPDMQVFSQVIINPLITHYSPETFDGREWCMSIADEQCFPQNRYQVKRSIEIIFDYTDANNQRHTKTRLSGIAAVVFQHEYDHLFGKLMDQEWISWKIISNEEYKRRIEDWEKMRL